MTEHESDQNSAVAINDIQLILAEKRTALAVMRTGIAVLAMPLSILSLLVATSKHYSALEVLPFLVPVLVILTCLTILGIYLVSHSLQRLHRYDVIIKQIKSNHRELADYIA